MTRIGTSRFGGISPRTPPRYLSDHQAQTAKNCPGWNGSLAPLRTTLLVTALSKIGTIRTIYRFGQDNSDETKFWFAFNADTDVTRGAIADDETERTFFADGISPPKVTYNSVALTGTGTDYPLASFNLGVPAPTTATTPSAVGTIPSNNAETVRYALAYYSAGAVAEGALSAEMAVEHVIGNSITFNKLPVPAAASTTAVTGNADTWVSEQFPRVGNFASAAYGGGRAVLFYEAGDQVAVIVNPDAMLTDVSTVNLPATSGGNFKYSAYGNGRYVALDYASQKTVSSQDALEWAAGTNGMGVGCRGVSFAAGYFLAIGADGRLAYSVDGLTWSLITQEGGVSSSYTGAAAPRAYVARSWAATVAIKTAINYHMQGPWFGGASQVSAHLIVASDNNMAMWVPGKPLIVSFARNHPGDYLSLNAGTIDYRYNTAGQTTSDGLFIHGITGAAVSNEATVVLARNDGILLKVSDFQIYGYYSSNGHSEFAIVQNFAEVAAPAGVPASLLWDGNNYVALPATGSTVHTSTTLSAWTARALPASYTFDIVASFGVDRTFLLTTQTPAAVSNVRLYHKRPGGSTWYLAATVAAGTTTITDADPAQTTGAQPTATPSLLLPTPPISNVTSATAEVPPPPDLGVGETRVYIYTFVSHLGEESAPSPPSPLVTLYPTLQTVALTGIALPAAATSGNNVTRKRIYRLASGTGSSEYLFVDEIAADVTTYADDSLAGQLGEACPSIDWLNPPPTLRGLVALPGGGMAGFVGRDVYLCEPGRPHAWPLKYQNTVDYPVVGLGAIDTTVVILTTGVPYFLQGSDPDNAVPVKSDLLQACVSKRSIVSMQGGVFYASPDGLVALSPAGSRNITESLYLREQWQALAPASIHAYQWENKYIGFYDNGTENGGFIFDPVSGEFVKHDVYATAGFLDRQSDALYLAVAAVGGNEIHRWDAGALLAYLWRSRKYSMPSETTFTAVRVEAEAYPVTFRAYGNGVLLREKIVTDRLPFRLPLKKIRDLEFELVGSVEVFSVAIAESVEELDGG